MTKQPLTEPLKMAHLYLISHHDEANSKGQREKCRDYLKPYIMGHGEPDENGNFIYEFPSAINLDGTWYKGLMAQRKVSEYVDEDKARELIQKHDLAGRCIRVVEVSEVDYDELYAANQEGVISDEDIDSIIETSESYALMKIKQ